MRAVGQIVQLLRRKVDRPVAVAIDRTGEEFAGVEGNGHDLPWPRLPGTAGQLRARVRLRLADKVIAKYDAWQGSGGGRQDHVKFSGCRRRVACIILRGNGHRQQAAGIQLTRAYGYRPDIVGHAAGKGLRANGHRD